MVTLAALITILQTPEPPKDLTSVTRANAKALAALERPGTILFTDDFESRKSLDSYFEVRGVSEKRVEIDTNAGAVHKGAGALRLTSKDNQGQASGAGASYWFGASGGYDRVYLRYYIRFAGDYDQGNLNHTGGSLIGVVGDNKWRGMGTAGKRPNGDDHLTCALETWRDWGRAPAPGYLFCYTYWMDMKIDKDGNYWGNMLGPTESTRIVPERGRWYCMEFMIKLNTIDAGVASFDGELAAWVDGKLYLHFRGIRWRKTAELKLKRMGVDVYIHQARKDNTVWYDDVAVSTGYIGPGIQ